MGFGGSAQAMITIIKNNENMRNKRKRRKALDGSYGKERVEFDFPESTPEKLELLLLKLKEERRNTFVKRAIVFIVVSALMIAVLVI